MFVCVPLGLCVGARVGNKLEKRKNKKSANIDEGSILASSFKFRLQTLIVGIQQYEISVGEMEVDAFRRLFPLRFHERHLLESIRPDARPLERARESTVALGAVASADGSAMAKIGHTTMLAAIKMEVMTPSSESPDEGCVAIDFHMPPICSPFVRPGRPAEVAPVIAKQLSDAITRHVKLFGT
ncbi:hypothetical protein NE237_008318 [Protea cynaroides]|uniref:Ribosomal RNA-processing protein 43 n=1 Tax=Protea cynaroides TaxID=273540 RepID=A0A9Q0KVF9_9MAGN|nr:hypothetical protein NE237_008318 [Protea cynaroides]